MKTGTTFPSDEEEWAWIERMARRRERLYNAARYAALFAFGIALMFAMLWFCARNMGAKHHDPWQDAINTVRSQSG